MTGEFNPRYVFAAEFEQALKQDTEKSGFALEDWFNSGNQKPETSANWWREHGHEGVQAFIDWYEQSGAQVWITPDGRPAVELELKVMFGDVEVVMYIDLVVVLNGELILVDYKSSAKPPVSVTQLAIYCSAIELAYGFRPQKATYFMTRGTGPRDAKPEDKIYFLTPQPMSSYEYSVEYLTREIAMIERGLQAGIFPAHPGDGCNRCGVSHACAAVGGWEARIYDPSHPEFQTAQEGVSVES